MFLFAYSNNRLVITLCALLAVQANAWAFSNQNNTADEKNEQWLKERFYEQHQKLIPVVAVADMFYACNLERKVDDNNHPISYLVNKMDKQLLAEQLQKCLAGDDLKSDVAINFGLKGCFHEQLAELPEAERQQKFKLVKQAIGSLSKEQRQQSLTQCVTDQAISYLK
ncbi:hypothetical protein [Thalassotalea sp. PLHSN55]|uniref:hypothetical protein n=1 Tax=Thalassotalea sp. PLHSN55 TaxID=3435888 RepID=UPI003F855D6A